MLRRAVVVLGTVALLLGAAWVGQAIAQAPAVAPNPAPDATKAAPGGRGDPAAMQARMDQFRQQMSDRMMEAFGATKEEWAIIQPRIEKVQTLSRQSRGGGGMGMMAGRGGPGGDRGRGGPPSDRPQSEVEKKGEALRKVLENKEAKAEDIKAALAGVLEARAAAKKELDVAQKELRDVLTVRQEGQCVVMGIL